MSTRILLVEDERKISAMIEQGLKESGHIVDMADTVASAQAQIKANRYDLILMDIMLPDGDGFALARQVRAEGFHGLIMMLTALSTTPDKITGLDAGADDYLTKPFDFNELLARIRALLRRKGEGQSVLSNGEISMDLIHRTVVRESLHIELTSREFALLEFFMRNVDKVLDREQISRQVWGTEFDPDSNVIDVYINHLRKKMDSPFPNKLLKTIVGHGYVLSKAH